jgi:hypothetical protein
MSHDNKKGERYEALNFPEIYPNFDDFDDLTYEIRSEIYRLRHRGWDKNEIVKGLILRYGRVENGESSITVGSINRHFEKCLVDSFGYKPIANEGIASRIIPNINAGLTALRFLYVCGFRDFEFTTPQTLSNSHMPDSEEIVKRRQKLLILRLNGAEGKIITSILPTYSETLILTETTRIRKNVFDGLSPEYKKLLADNGFKKTALIYSALIGLYASGQLNFDTTEKMADFNSVVESMYGRKILTADEVKELIITPSNN